jgi:drug/metabolite transporter (DMT)-like permease
VTWAGLVYSMLFALVAAYILWYRSVRDVGNLRTAIYSNLVPVFGALFGVLILGEKVTIGLLGGGLCIFAGILLTRMARHGEGRSVVFSAPQGEESRRE